MHDSGERQAARKGPRLTRSKLLLIAAVAVALYFTGPAPTFAWTDRVSDVRPSPAAYETCRPGYLTLEALCVDRVGSGPSYQPALTRAAVEGRDSVADDHHVGLYLARPRVRLFEWSRESGLAGFGVCRTLGFGGLNRKACDESWGRW